MSQLIVRNLDSKLVDALKKQAAEHGRSAEAEHRAILADALLKPKKRLFTEVLASMPNVGDDEDFARINGLDNSRVFD